MSLLKAKLIFTPPHRHRLSTPFTTLIRHGDSLVLVKDMFKVWLPFVQESTSDLVVVLGKFGSRVMAAFAVLF